ncbi:MAG TPA: DNA polymerase I [Longimicrobiales bacterium]|nr:DNA polymerase I [Longimicrobiales bacterium]
MVETPPKSRPRLFLIDGYALIYRAYFAMIQRPLTTSRGENTSAAFGFTRFLIKILEEYAPDYLGVVLDAGTSKRTELYPEYKATREKMPDDLQWSLPKIREVIEGFRIPVIALPDHEADDVIGTLARRAAASGLEAVIVSGDKDFYQLIGDGIALLNPGRGGAAGVEEEWIGAGNAAERLGVPPEHVVDYLALIGDSSDNVPGARGIGPKTAIQLIEQYGSVDSILENAESIRGKRAREALVECADDVRLSKQLVTIQDDLPVELDLEALKVIEPDRNRLRDVFVELEFTTLARDYGVEAARPEAVHEADYGVADTVEAVAEVVARARAAGTVSIGVQGDSPLALVGDMVGLALATEPGQAWYLPLRHRPAGMLALDGLEANLPPLADAAMKPLVDLLEDPSIAKVGHDLKQSLLRLRQDGVALQGVTFDTMIASYVLDPGRRDQSLDGLVLEHLGVKLQTREEFCGRGRDAVAMAECKVEQMARYAAAQADMALRLRPLLAEEMTRLHLDDLCRNIELPLIEVLAEMEWHGIAIAPDFFRDMSRRLARDLALTQQEIWKLAGEEFNINSTPQLRVILFEKLGLPVLRKTKTGPSTDASVLEELAAQGYDLPRLLLEFRQIDKLKSTYVDALPQLVNPRTRRIHSSFNQTVAATGRLSSSDPNLQNIPIRTDQGAVIRKGFVPAEGYRFVTADYSQIELRILAHFSGDPAFVEAFRSGADIHRQTAAIMFGVPVESVSAEMRAAAKTVNFATIYGIGAFALSSQLGTSVQEAKEFIDNYFVRFPHVRRYLDEQIEKARQHGYVETISGRRRYIPEITSRNYNIRQFGERAATNAPVQGSAADIIKLAMITIHRELAGAGSGTRMLLQVHDELVLEAPAAEADAAQVLVKRVMENAYALDVPLEVVTGTGANWYECK